MTADAEALRTRLRHVYWIGGGSGAGKSTIARRLAARYGLPLVVTDDIMSDHAGRSTPGDSPHLHAFMAMGMDERWVTRSPETMLETFHWFRGEGFGLIVDDLLRLPDEPGVIVEGFRLLPRLVQPLLAAPGHAVWLLPTPGFRRAGDVRPSRSARSCGRWPRRERAHRGTASVPTGECASAPGLCGGVVRCRLGGIGVRAVYLLP